MTNKVFMKGCIVNCTVHLNQSQAFPSIVSSLIFPFSIINGKGSLRLGVCILTVIFLGISSKAIATLSFPFTPMSKVSFGRILVDDESMRLYLGNGFSSGSCGEHLTSKLSGVLIRTLVSLAPSAERTKSFICMSLIGAGTLLIFWSDRFILKMYPFFLSCPSLPKYPPSSNLKYSALLDRQSNFGIGSSQACCANLTACSAYLIAFSECLEDFMEIKYPPSVTAITRNGSTKFQLVLAEKLSQLNSSQNPMPYIKQNEQKMK